MKNRNIILLAFLLFLYIAPSFFAMTSYSLPSPTQQNTSKEFVISDGELWYDENFHYRKLVTIDYGGDASDAGSDYQIEIPITYNAHMQTDFDDIRFTEDDGNTTLDYWRESYVASTSAVFWVEISDYQEVGVTVSIYMYYGNSTVSTTSNGTATFEFFNDWTSTPIINDGEGTYGISDDTWLYASSYGTGGTWHGPKTDSSEFPLTSALNAGGRLKVKLDFDCDDSVSVVGLLDIFLVSSGGVNQGRIRMTDTSLVAVAGNLEHYDDIGSPIQLGTSNAKTDWTGTTELCWYEQAGTDWWTSIDSVADESGDRDMDWSVGRIDIDGPWSYSTNTPATMRIDYIFTSKFILNEPDVIGFGAEEDNLPDPEWREVGEAELVFIVPIDETALNWFLIILGMFMVPASTLYLVKGGKNNMSMDKVFYFIVAFLFGWGLIFIGVT